MALQGDLKDMELTEVIQFACRRKNNARISVQNGQRDGSIFVANGQVLHAVYGNKTGEEAVYELLRWHDGEFILENEISSPQKTIQISWHALLLQGMKYIDESRNDTANGDTIRDVLRELADSLNGFVAAQIVGQDRQPIKLVEDDDFDSERSQTLLSQILETAHQSLEQMDAGAFLEMITHTEKYRFIIRPIDGYHIRIVLDANGSIGAARMYLADKEAELLSFLSANGS